MPHQTELIATIAAGLGLAFLFGLLAVRLRLPPIVGYLLAGVAVGPHSPGFVADPSLAQQLAEIGVILLMFGVGIHFSLDDLLSVRRMALPGAAVQIAVATLLGALLVVALMTRGSLRAQSQVVELLRSSLGDAYDGARHSFLAGFGVAEDEVS